MPLSANGACFFSELRLLLSGIEVERIGGGGCSYGQLIEALQVGTPAKRVEDAGTCFGAKVAAAAAVLKLAQRTPHTQGNSRRRCSTALPWGSEASIFSFLSGH